jgi:hypothetical protein
MNRQEQIAYCSKCIHQSFDQKKGMVCGLTSLVPIIEVECPEISIDPKFEKLEAWKKTSKEKYQNLNVNFDINDFNLTALLYGIGLLIIGVSLTIYSYLNAHPGSTYSIYWGLVLVGMIKIFSSEKSKNE